MKHLLLAAAIISVAGCGSTAPSINAPPSYTRATANYRQFSSADEIGAYLRYDSPTGPLVSAHRGGPVRAYPENAIATFERTLRLAPAFLETDVRMTADDEFVMMHDDTLDRTSTGSGPVSEQTLGDLRKHLLKDNLGVVTPFRIPTLDEALAWADGRTILMLDIKLGVDPGALVDRIRSRDAQDRVVLIMYSYEQLAQYLEIASDLVYSVPAVTIQNVDALLRSGLPLTRAIGWVGVGDYDADVVHRLHSLNVKAMFGTYGETDERARRAGKDVYMPLLEAGIDVLASDNTDVAVEATLDFTKFNR